MRGPPAERAGGEGTSGFVLVAAVLLLLAFTGVAHATFVLAAAELRVARAGSRLEAVEAVAAGALTDGFALLGRSLDSVPAGARVELITGRYPTAWFRTTAWRLSAESWLLEAEASGDEGGVRRAGALGWRPSPVHRVAALRAVVTTGAGAVTDVAGQVVADSILLGPECGPWGSVLDSAGVSAMLPAAGTIADGAGRVGLGALAAEDLLARLPGGLGRSGTPVPLEVAGECVDAPWNWGAPTLGTSPCAGRVVARSASGRLAVVGGGGAALLFVDGDLVIEGGAEITGLLLVSGRLSLTGGSSFRGMAVALGGGTVDGSSSISGSACLAARAIEESSRALSELLRLPGGARLGPF